ncbi:UNVERIFIED_CONTAM: hypothetical protein FKN15_012734 [Acipenser sinensis]
MCEEHGEEKINIYCLTCETPTCSMCKVFGAHKDCEVAPLQNVYKRQKVQMCMKGAGNGVLPWSLTTKTGILTFQTELSDGIAMLVSGNDRIQAMISKLEEMCKTIEDKGRQQKQHLCRKFDTLCSVLEERKKELLLCITLEQDEKLAHVRALSQQHGDHLEGAAKLVETCIQSMEEKQMAAFLQGSLILYTLMTDTAKASNMERTEPGYENMDHFIISTGDVSDMLRTIDFQQGTTAHKQRQLIELFSYALYCN